MESQTSEERMSAQASAELGAMSQHTMKLEDTQVLAALANLDSFGTSSDDLISEPSGEIGRQVRRLLALHAAGCDNETVPCCMVLDDSWNGRAVGWKGRNCGFVGVWPGQCSHFPISPLHVLILTGRLHIVSQSSLYVMLNAICVCTGCQACLGHG